VILIDHLKEVYIDGVLETIDTTNWLPKVMRKDYIVGLNLAASGPDPDQNLYLLYGCDGDLNYKRVLQPGGRQADRAAVDRGRRGAAQATGLGYRTQAGRGWRAADHLLFPGRNLLATLCEGADLNGQQHLQRQPPGGHMARQVA